MDELNAVTAIDVSGLHIADLYGYDWFTNVETLDCSNNLLQELYIVNELSNLISFDVSNNKLTYLDLQNESLETLDCTNNEIDYLSINPSNNYNLKTLNISNNKLTYLNLDGLGSLETLDCSNNEIDFFHVDAYNNSYNLKTLNISNNKLTDFSFSGFEKLETLDCSYNFVNVDDEAFFNNYGVKKDEYYCSISLPDSLKKLDISHNDLKNEEDSYGSVSSFAFPSSLEEVDCSYNKFKKISLNSELVILNCSHNELTEIENIPVTKLEKIDCSYNWFSYLSDRYSSNSSFRSDSLKILDCSNNYCISELDISYLNALEELNCSNCNLNDSTTISLPSGLKKLDCSDNLFTSDNVYSDLSEIVEVDISNNYIVNLSWGYGNDSLEKLDCSGNQITEIYFDRYVNVNLKTLNCSGNKLTYLDLSSCYYLEELICNDNVYYIGVEGTNVPYIDYARTSNWVGAEFDGYGFSDICEEGIITYTYNVGNGNVSNPTFRLVCEEDVKIEPDIPADRFDLSFAETETGIVIMDYTGEDEKLVIPAYIDGRTVTAVEIDSISSESSIRKVNQLVIPSTVTSVCFFDEYGGHIFSSLESIKIDYDNPNYTVKDDVVFSKDEKTLILYPPKRKGAEYSVLTGVEIIDKAAFSYAENLEAIDLPDSLTAINELAFCGSALKEIVIPSSVGDNMGDGVFMSCRKLENVALPGGIKTIGHSFFHDCTLLKSVVIPDGVTEICSRAFGSCSSLESITIPDSVEAIDSTVFEGSDKIAEVTIGSALFGIYFNDLFPNCKKLIISKGTQELTAELSGSSYNSSVEEIYLPSDVTAISYDFISEFNWLCKIYVDEENEFYKNVDDTLIRTEDNAIIFAFYDYSQNGDFVFPDGVEIIPEGFYCHNYWKTITIPESVKEIGYYVFDRNYNLNLETVYYSGSKIEWDKIKIGDNNYRLLDAEIVYGKLLTPEVTPPTAKVLCYNGYYQELINPGSTTGGELIYRLEGGQYGPYVPHAKDIGTYTVYYKVFGCDGYSDTEEKSITVEIKSIITPEVTAPTTNDLRYTGAPQVLITAGSTTGGTMVYKLDDGEYSENIPVATEAGTYTVYYKVIGNEIYSGTDEQYITVEIKPLVVPEVTAPTAKDLRYTGAPQVLIIAGSTTGGTMVYKLDGGEYSENIPVATEAGTYTVYYKVIGNEIYSGTDEQSITVEIKKPVLSVPGNIKANLNDANITVSWNSVDDATAYDVYRNKILVGTVNSETFVDKNVEKGKTYSYFVKAYNKDFDIYSESSASVTVSIPDYTKPQNVKVVAGNGSATLTWDAVSGAKQYSVYYYADGKYTNVSTKVKTESYTVTGLTNGKEYGFLVRAYVDGAWSTYTSADRVYATPTTKPQNVKVVAGNGSATLTWDAVNGARRYVVYYFIDGKYTNVSNKVTGTTFTITGLTNGREYGFLVRAYVDGAWSTYTSADRVYATPEV